MTAPHEDIMIQMGKFPSGLIENVNAAYNGKA